MRVILFLAAFLTPVVVFAQSEQEDKVYCKYTTEQAMAQRDLLRTPSAVIGPVQPSSGTPPQLVFGITDSIANIRKASLTMRAARASCGLYSATVDAQMRLVYALPQIEKDVLNNRLRLIQGASDKLDALMAENMKYVKVNNLSLPSVYPLTSAKIRLDENRTTTLTGIASPYVPKLSDTPLRVLIADKSIQEDLTKKAEIKIQKESTWDIQLGVGVHRQLPGSVYATKTWGGAYGEFTIVYNFGRRAIDRHLDTAGSAYADWKSAQFSDVVMQASFLKKQIEETLLLQTEQIHTMLEHASNLSDQIKSIEGVETNNAIAFRNNLLADQILLAVNIGDAQFRIDRLRQYLTDNF